MLETKSLILDKARLSDWEPMYRNVWSHPESAKYMYWNVTTSEADARTRIRRTIEFQKTHDTYLVYEKAGGEAIGFAGVEKLEENIWEEAGICLGPDFVRKGYGKQIVLRLMQYCREEKGAKEFIYSAFEQNEPSKALARSLGFRLIAETEETDERNGQSRIKQRYMLRL